MKQQVIFINGGTSKENFRDYYDFLRQTSFDPYETPFKNWNKTLWNFLWSDYEYWRIPIRERSYADYTAWKIMFEKSIPFFRDDIIFISTSQGSTFILKYLIENPFSLRIKKIFFLAAALHDTQLEKLGTFEFDISKISWLQDMFGQIYIYHSSDDDIVSMSDSEELASYFTKAEFRKFRDKGHFYQLERFVEVEEDIKK